eukprot:441198-Pelagomonas_calceolata.AAC.7
MQCSPRPAPPPSHQLHCCVTLILPLTQHAVHDKPCATPTSGISEMQRRSKRRCRLRQRCPSLALATCRTLVPATQPATQASSNSSCKRNSSSNGTNRCEVVRVGECGWVGGWG